MFWLDPDGDSYICDEDCDTENLTYIRMLQKFVMELTTIVML